MNSWFLWTANEKPLLNQAADIWPAAQVPSHTGDLRPCCGLALRGTSSSSRGPRLSWALGVATCNRPKLGFRLPILRLSLLGRMSFNHKVAPWGSPQDGFVFVRQFGIPFKGTWFSLSMQRREILGCSSHPKLAALLNGTPCSTNQPEVLGSSRDQKRQASRNSPSNRKTVHSPPMLTPIRVVVSSEREGVPSKRHKHPPINQVHSSVKSSPVACFPLGSAAMGQPVLHVGGWATSLEAK